MKIDIIGSVASGKTTLGKCEGYTNRNIKKQWRYSAWCGYSYGR